MKIGILMHPGRGVDALYEEARQADRQGYDSIWLFDHLMDWTGKHGPDAPLDYFTVMVALGAITSRVRLAWSMLNVSFRRPAVLAKSLATLDVLTKGRVICSVGSGWFKEEYDAYDVPLIDDHDERVQFAREVVALFKELWTHPGPARTNFDGKFVKVRNLPFNPAPVQKPHPPIWFGGDSDATLSMVKDLADGWVMLKSGNKKRLAEILGAPDWPKHPMAVMKNQRVFVADTRDAAIQEARAVYDQMPAASQAGPKPSFDDFIAREIVGTQEECLRLLAEVESWGINYVRVECTDAAHQERIARLILPRLGK